MRTYNTVLENRKKNDYSFSFHIFIAVAILIQLVVLFRWQIIEKNKWTTRAKSYHYQPHIEEATRGIIKTEDGTILAIDEPAWIVYAALSSNERERETFNNNKELYLEEVSKALELSKEDLRNKIPEGFRYVKLADGVSNEKKKVLEKIKISEAYREGFGLSFELKEKRVYPNGRLASHVLGFIGQDAEGNPKGQYGIEGFYSKDINERSTNAYQEKDFYGNVILTKSVRSGTSRTGKDITLTIQPIVQKKVEEILRNRVETMRAKSGSVIIMETETGKIIAMANYPDYDPNYYWKAGTPEVFRNKAVSDIYEFGSVQKPITISIALESGKIGANYTCTDNTGYIDLYDYRISTWDKLPGGTMSLSQILEKSHNPCVVNIALATGFEYYYNKLQEFGYGNFHPIGLEDEAFWYLQEYETWTKLDLAVSSFGQSMAATPLQVLTAINTIGNDGKRVDPIIVSKIEDSYQTIDIDTKVISTPISPETAKSVRYMMESVVKYSEVAKLFNRSPLRGYHIAGKTGTAQIARKDKVGYYEDRTNATFVGFVPTENPKISMIVKVEEPKSSTFSSNTAVPLWIDILVAVKDDLEIPTE